MEILHPLKSKEEREGPRAPVLGAGARVLLCIVYDDNRWKRLTRSGGEGIIESVDVEKGGSAMENGASILPALPSPVEDTTVELGGWLGC